MLNNNKLREVYDRTEGRCHFCGDKVTFEKYGFKTPDDVHGVWEADHIHQKGKGGDKDAKNCLPACYRCNRLRWHRQGDEIRELLSLGLIAKGEIRKGSEFGKKLILLRKGRELQNIRRRRSVVVHSEQ